MKLKKKTCHWDFVREDIIDIRKVCFILCSIFARKHNYIIVNRKLDYCNLLLFPKSKKKHHCYLVF